MQGKTKRKDTDANEVVNEILIDTGTSEITISSDSGQLELALPQPSVDISPEPIAGNQDKNLDNPEIENKKNSPKTGVGKQKTSQPRKKKSPQKQDKDDKDTGGHTEIEHITDIDSSDINQADFENIPPHIKATVHEEVFEFDLSDPSTDPVAVIGDAEESYRDDYIQSNLLNRNSEDVMNTEEPDIDVLEIEVEPPITGEHQEKNIDTEFTITYNSDQNDSITDDLQVETPEIDTIDISPVSDMKLHEELPPNEDKLDVPAVQEEHLQTDDSDDSLVVLKIEDTEETPSEALADNNIQPLYQETTEQDDYLDEEDEIPVELGGYLHDLEKNSDNINRIVVEEDGLSVDVDTSREHIILINNQQDFMKYQHTIMDNRCISFFWPADSSGLIGFRISISTEKDKTFVIDLDKVDISLLSALMNAQRPIKVFFNAKPLIIWCKNNGLSLSHIFDVTTAINILTDGKDFGNSIKSLINRHSNKALNSDIIDLQDFVLISKFLIGFRKKLVDSFQTLEIMDVLNLEQRILFAAAMSESNGMPYNEAAPNPMAQSIWELVESKHGVTNKKELSKSGVFSLCKSYLNERKDLLEVREYISAETSEKIRQSFDTKRVIGNRICSTLAYGPSASIVTSDYSFAGEGLYSFISPEKDKCLVEGCFKDLEIRVIAMMLNKAKLLQSFHTEEGPYAYFAAPLFDKKTDEITLDEKFKAKMILEMIVRDLGERETLFYAWNTYQAYIKEDEIADLKKRFKKAHPDLMKLIRETKKQAEKNGYVTTSTGRISVVKSDGKAFFTKVEMYMNDIFKNTLDLFYHDLQTYNADYSPEVTLCTIYDRIITLECDKKIVNIAIDMLTRNMTRTAARILGGIPVSVKVYGTEQWEV